jgi:hypothetical protein
MAVSKGASDIHALLGDHAELFVDSREEISFMLARQASITSATLLEIYEVLPHTRCEVNFDERMIIFRQTDATETLSRSPRPCELVGETVSEKHAVRMAATLGAIDFDDLVPSFTLSNEGDSTRLIIGRLLRVSHDTLVEQLSAQCTRFEYRMEKKQTVLHFATEKKRKAS